MAVLTEVRDNLMIVKIIEPRVNAAKADAVRQEVLEAAEEHGGHLVVDLSDVQAIDSSGVGILIGIARRLGSARELVLAGSSAGVRSIFEMTRIDRVISVRDSVALAVEEFGKAN